MTYSKLTITVSNNLLGVLIQVLTDKRISDFRVEPCDIAPTKPIRKAQGKRGVANAVYQIIKASPKPITVAQIVEVLPSEFYKPSVSSAMTRLVKQKTIKQVSTTRPFTYTA